MQEDSAGTLKRQKQVPGEMESLNNAIESLAKVVEETETCLSSSLVEPTPPDESKSKDDGSIVPLANDIRSVRYRVVSQSDRLRNMLDRLEL